MSSTHLSDRVQETLSSADVRINGTRPWDITVHNDRTYARILREGSLGLGESYVDGWWDCAELDQFFCKILNAGLDRGAGQNWRTSLHLLKYIVLNPQRKSHSSKSVERHYDLGNDLFQDMLDRRMIYSPGLWRQAANLDEAQEAKLEFVCRQLALERGMKVLDIGCGWGGFAKFAATKYGVEVVGITLSREQLTLGRSMCEGLPVELRLEDYRNLRGSFDRVVSLGMFEHVGRKNYATFFDVTLNALSGGGKLYLGTIGSYCPSRTNDPWIERYIFPNSYLPSIAEIGEAIQGRLEVEEWQNWAPDYDRTLMAWFHNFDAHWENLKARYTERFYRMWKFYLLLSAGGFRSRRLHDWQILLSPLRIARKAAA